MCPVWDGAKWVMVTFAEVSQLTTDATLSPAAVANNANYDVFGWITNGALVATRGPLWSSDTARGTGAGTTELDFTKGIPRNKNNITNGPAAGFGTYLGTIRSNGSAQIDMKFGSAAVGGGEARLCVWNAHNRVNLRAQVQDTTVNWAYGSPAVRPKNNSNTWRITMVRGLNEDAVRAVHHCTAFGGSVAANYLYFGIGLDSTTAHAADAAAGILQLESAVANGKSAEAVYHGWPGLGLHYLQATEGQGDNVASWAIYGTSSGIIYSNLTADLRG
jgi:hypothetical protein